MAGLIIGTLSDAGGFGDDVDELVVEIFVTPPNCLAPEVSTGLIWPPADFTASAIANA